MSDKPATHEQAPSPPRLWVVSELYYPEETSTGYYLTRTAEGLTDLFDVKVICGQPNYSARGTRAPKHEIRHGVELFRAAGTTLNKNVIPFRVINMVTLGLSVLFHGLRRFRSGDRVLVVTTPPSMPFLTAIASLTRGAAYTLLIHDNYPEILIAAGKGKRGGLVVTTIDFFNRWLYKHASKIIAVGRDMRELLENKTAGLDVPIDVIPNWAELETVEPRPREDNQLIAELGLQEKFVFLYAGNMGYPNDLETIVEAAALLSSQGDERLHFIFLGAGVKKAWLVREVERRSLKNITILSPRPREEQITFLNACDVALVSLVGAMRGVSMPSRTYNILAAGKPILALTEKGSEISLVVEEDSVGEIVEPGDVHGFVAAARKMAAMAGSELKTMGESARRAATTKYSLETALEAYRRAIR